MGEILKCEREISTSAAVGCDTLAMVSCKPCLFSMPVNLGKPAIDWVSRDGLRTEKLSIVCPRQAGNIAQITLMIKTPDLNVLKS